MSGHADSLSGGRVAVVGGGLAGLAAAVALCRRGMNVELFETRRRLGGRASSFRDRETGQWIDRCQHVAMGCCTNLAHFCRQTGNDRCFDRHRRLHFFGPDAALYELAASRWLPAPLHLAPALMRLGYLTLRDRLRILRAVGRLARTPADRNADQETIARWLRRHGQSEQAVEGFWSVVLLSALSETLEHISLAAARKVFVDGFLAAEGAYELEVPNLALEELFGRRTTAWLTRHGAVVRAGTRVRQIEGDGERVAGVVLPDDSRRQFDYVVVAVPWRQVRPLFSAAMLEALPSLARVDEIRSAPITAVHLWLDRSITPLPHAVLVGRTSQWVFQAKRGRESFAGTARRVLCTKDSRPLFGSGHYYQVVISASHDLAGRPGKEVAAEIWRELGEIWPAARDARLLRHRLITQPSAVFSSWVGLDGIRPPQQTPIANLALAGDWTRTGWPATMESAVRSGYLAAEAILKTAGKPEKVLADDLPRGCLARWLLPSDEPSVNIDHSV